MKFTVKNNSKENINNLMRKLGYFFLEQHNDEFNFIKALEHSGYPRFHIYLKINPINQEITFNLHIDQKKPAYKGASAHNADYEGEVVEREAQRIKQLLQNQRSLC